LTLGDNQTAAPKKPLQSFRSATIITPLPAAASKLWSPPPFSSRLSRNKPLPPVAAPIGKAPIGKAPLGKLPFGALFANSLRGNGASAVEGRPSVARLASSRKPVTRSGPPRFDEPPRLVTACSAASVSGRRTYRGSARRQLGGTRGGSWLDTASFARTTGSLCGVRR
jgi:hypothetical protein